MASVAQAARLVIHFEVIFRNWKASEDVLPTGLWAALSLVELLRRLALAVRH